MPAMLYSKATNPRAPITKIVLRIETSTKLPYEITLYNHDYRDSKASFHHLLARAEHELETLVEEFNVPEIK